MSIKILSLQHKDSLPYFLLLSFLIHLGFLLIMPDAGIEKRVLPRLIPVEIIELPQPAKTVAKKQKAESKPLFRKEEVSPLPQPLQEEKPVMSYPERKPIVEREPLSAEPKPFPKEDSPEIKSGEIAQKKEAPVTLYPSMDRLAELSKEYEEQVPVAEKDRDITFETSEPRYVSYMEALKARIYHKWEYPDAAAREGQAGRLFIHFSILRNGTLEEVTLIKSSGYPMLDNAALTAIKLAAPFNPFPKHFGSLERITINASFEYILEPYIIRKSQ